ncbi:G/U mismatch-specific DNA glycosylase [Neobacillus sp. YIM B06451]|uniref:G/U mismatch-specific DNA glycosylase n=1 Tax=Neobacillus sp. YIM B06451 TaxID=3070994 RepID=UPI0029309619|nr:G/U mismatch-specific DNA glycosylase [Neobacillus sp. YIM B06451]
MLRDHLKENLDILFVGFNPSLVSGETGHHFANPNNRFWKILYRASITPRLYKPEEDWLLPEIGLGLTNIVERPTRAADEITKEEYSQGRVALNEKIKAYRPLIVCYVGKGVYQQFSRKKEIPWGMQPEPVVTGTTDFVAPSSSGLVRMRMEEIVEIYKELPDLVSRLREK